MNRMARSTALMLIAFVLLGARAVRAQWEIENSGTTADLRGIDNVGGGVAWASGTNGTILRTEDGGYAWQNCTIPPDAVHLDFRGIQAFDANTAIVMSSGKGDLSRLYKTTDGCHTWKLVFMNPDKDGFWDAVVASVVTAEPGDVCDGGSKLILGTILGDPSIHKSNPSDTNTMLSFYLANFVRGLPARRTNYFQARHRSSRCPVKQPLRQATPFWRDLILSVHTGWRSAGV